MRGSYLHLMKINYCASLNKSHTVSFGFSCFCSLPFCLLVDLMLLLSCYFIMKRRTGIKTVVDKLHLVVCFYFILFCFISVAIGLIVQHIKDILSGNTTSEIDGTIIDSSTRQRHHSDSSMISSRPH